MRKMLGASESSSIYIWAICVSNILANILSLILTSKAGSYQGMTIASWVVYVIMQVGFIGTIFVYGSIRKLDVVSIARFTNPINIKQIILIPFIAVATILVFLPLANLWSSFLSIIGYNGGVLTPNVSNVGVYFLTLFIMAVIPAFGEEFLMRGTVFPGLSTRNIWFGILMSGLFFSLMHANPYQTVHQFGLGVVLAIVFVLTGSIWPCILLHFLNNFISLTITAFIPAIDEWYIQLGYWNWLTGTASVIIGLFILSILLFLLYKAKYKDNSSYATSVSGDGYTLYLPADQYGLKKENIFKQTFKFVKSLFTKNGWRNITSTLDNVNGVQYLGKNQNMVGVWIALGLVVVYWVITFIAGLV